MPAIAPALASTLTPPTHGAFTLTLTKAIVGETPPYLPMDIQFAYDWNSQINWGNATVLSIGGNTTDQPMPQMRLSKHLSFVSKNRFWITVDDGKDEIYAYRVILDLDKDTGENKQAAVMVGIGAKLIVGTENWNSSAELL
ncbi:hypothetical protein AA313_de0210380 [Arthrobotrys entomopaga]|nr:hypothetical protein AA313_de0210380 [Arthrobotrys entomopaga]